MILTEGFDPSSGFDGALPFNALARTASLEYLGIPGVFLQRYRALLRAPQGLLIVCGPTGNGKTATLRASLDERAIVRGQQAKILVLDEIGEWATARAAVYTALSGQRVLATLQANATASAVDHLLQFGVLPQDVGAALSGILAQRLLRRLCVACRQWRRLAPELRKRFGLSRTTHAYGAQGCIRCNRTGYSTQTAIFECLFVDDAFRQALAAGSRGLALLRVAAANGYQSMLHDGIRKARLGDTSFEEVWRVTGAGCIIQ